MARATSTGFRAGTWLGAALLVVALGIVFVPSGCRAGTTPNLTARPSPVRLAIGYGGPVDIPGMGLQWLRGFIAAERLVQLGRDGHIEPALAERWQESADGLTWRFFLRDNLTFHDGSPITADVIAERLRGCNVGAACQDISGIQVENPRTVAVMLRRPSALLLESLTYIGIISKDKAGAGPFHQVPDSKGDAYDAFPAYHRGRPQIDGIDFKLFPTARNAWAALMRGEIDMLYEVTPEALDFIERSSDTQVRSFLRPYAFTMALNVRHPILRDRDVRRALNLAVNRTDIITRVFRGRGYPATDHLWPRHWAYNHEMPRLRYDPAAAIQLLEGRGLHITATKAATRSSSDTPSRFHFTCLIPEHDMRFERIGLMLQRQLIEAGVDMQFETVSFATLAERVSSGKFDAFLVDLVATPGLVYPDKLWHSPQGPAEIIDSGYTAADPALDAIRAARTDADTRAAVEQFQRIMREDPPAVFLFWSETARAVSARFQVPLTPDRDIFATLPQWQLASPTSAPASP
jgi:peptide/nickel transport system substrate-binding protein